MRGAEEQPGSTFSYAPLEQCVPQDHPLRAILRITDPALERLSPPLGTPPVSHPTFGCAFRRSAQERFIRADTVSPVLCQISPCKGRS